MCLMEVNVLGGGGDNRDARQWWRWRLRFPNNGCSNDKKCQVVEVVMEGVEQWPMVAMVDGGD